MSQSEFARFMALLGTMYVAPHIPTMGGFIVGFSCVLISVVAAFTVKP